MTSLSVGNYGALRYRYKQLKDWQGNPTRSRSAGLESYQIYTPWLTTFNQNHFELSPDQRIRHQYSIPILRRDVNKNHKLSVDWRTNYYDPLDQRTKEVPSKPKVFNGIPCDSTDTSQFVPEPAILYTSRNPPGKYRTAMSLQNPPYISMPSTRSEEWSTLRQMLPSHGPLLKKDSSERWGTGSDYLPKYAINPKMASTLQESFPRVNSAMSKYAHEAYFHDNMFKMF